MSRQNKNAPESSEAAPVQSSEFKVQSSKFPAPEPEPKEFAGRPQGILSLCNIAGHAWEKKTSRRGQWQFHQCKNPDCGKIVEVKPVA